jgi:GAF domain
MRTVPALAIRAGEDPLQVSLRLGDAHQRFMLSHLIPRGVRPVVAASWRRCAVTGLSGAGNLPPVRLDTAGLADYRSRHPLAAVMPVFRDLLGDQSGDCAHVFAITDATGILLWVEGDIATLRRAERMNFVPGAGWSEADAGTNAPGTALVTRSPVQIFTAEHYNTLVHGWSCVAAPVRDPASGQILGVIDLTGGANVASPHALALVRAAARVAEAELACRAAATRGRAVAADLASSAGRLRAADPSGSAPAAIQLTALGRDCALARVDGRTLQLRPRHSEIAVILALTPGGLPGPRLAVQLSETEIQPVTLRAEMSRLRALLGDGLLGSHPYEFRRPVGTDFGTVLGLLAQGRVADAVAAYSGPLLPDSEAPAIVDCRAALDQQIRAEVLASGDAAILRHWLNAPWGTGDDAAWRALASALPAGSPQRAAAAARARALDQQMAG